MKHERIFRSVDSGTVTMERAQRGVERTGPTGGGLVRVVRRGQSDEDKICGNRRIGVHDRSFRGLATAGPAGLRVTVWRPSLES